MGTNGWTPETVAAIADARSAVRMAAVALSEANHRRKDAAEFLKDKKAELDRVIDESLDGQGRIALPFGSDDSTDPPANGSQTPGGPFAAATDEDWRAVPITKIPNLKPKQIEALEAANLWTIGHLADYTATGGELDQLGGIGVKGAESIQESLVEFWTTWNGQRSPISETPKPND